MSASAGQIKQIILNSHFRNIRKIVHEVRKTHPGTPKQIIEDVLDSLPKDKYHLKGTDSQAHYYHTIFTPYIGGWQVDLLVQSEKAQKNTHMASYFFVAVNVNTRFAWVSPIRGKTKKDFESVLGQFIDDMNQGSAQMKGGRHHVKQPAIVKIVADKEGGLGACKNFLRARNIDLQTVPSERHSTLGIVDRFIRTLRDMNARQQDKTSDHPHVRDFTVKMMNELVDEYNHSLHTSTGLTPIDMQTNPDKQKEYIIRKIYEKNRRGKIRDDLEKGSWVRFMIPRHFTKKHRFQVSPEMAQIVGKQGKSYVVRAGSETKVFSRWRLFPVDDPSQLKQARTFGF
jgi:hypothetical protein